MHSRWFNAIVIAVMLLGMIPFSAQAAPLETDPDSVAETTGVGDGPTAEIETALLNKLEDKGKADFVVVMEEQADLSKAYEIEDWDERGKYVYDTLRATASRTQSPVVGYAIQRDLEYESFFSVNTIHVKGGDLRSVQDIASLPGVAVVREPKVAHIDPDALTKNVLPQSTGYGWNLDELDPDNDLYGMQAAQVWDQYGIRGEGIIVANIDTGVTYEHEALVRQYRGNLSGGSFDHDFNWYAPTPTGQGQCGGAAATEPCDHNGHGSGTAGIMVGETEGLTEQNGAAPGAKWIACMGCDSGTGCSEAALTGCADWYVAPCPIGADPGDPSCDPSQRPHVINNSWGGGTGDTWYQGYIQAWVAAGMFPAFSAGNTVACAALGSPGDNPEAFGTAAHNSTGQNMYAGGPSTFYPNPSCDPEAHEIDPHLNAPTFGRTPGNSPGSYFNLSGTSGASPHTAGAVALIWAANPGLVGDMLNTFTILEQSTNHNVPEGDCGKPACAGSNAYPNYEYGWGYLDALAAVQEAQLYGGGLGYIDGQVTDADSGDPIEDAAVTATLEGQDKEWQDFTDESGMYDMTVFSGTYTLDAFKYGYSPAQFTNLSVVSGTTTTQNIALTPATYYTVDGTVTDAATGWPLYAQISVAGYPGEPVWTDPETGAYSISLAEGVTYTFQVEAWVDGYDVAERIVGPLTGDITEDFELTVDLATCSAPGYTLNFDDLILSEDFDAGIPATWDVVNNGGSCVWRDDDPDGRGNLTGGSGIFAIADSDNCGLGSTMNTELRTPAFDATGYDLLIVEYKNDYNDLGSIAEVDIYDGIEWTTIDDMSGTDYRGPMTRTASTGVGAGSSEAQVRWHYQAGWDWWWEVDEVRVYGGQCVAPTGGLVVGNVYDANDPLVALNGAEVVNEAGYAAETMPTPEDGDVDDGFYTLFSPSGGHVFTATMEGGYAADAETVAAVTGDTIRQDFALPAGLLSATPEGVEAVVPLGYVATETLSLGNIGGAAAMFELGEADLGFDILGLAQKNEPRTDAEVAPTSLPIRPQAFADELFRIDAEGSTGHLALLGVEYANGSYFVTSGGETGSGDANYLFELDAEGNVLNSWPQSTSSTWGWRDMAFDGDYLYASDSAVVDQIDPATGQATGVTIPCPTNPCRALAYDPATDHFWTANFSSDIWEFDRDGNIVNQYANSLAIYGAAWDMWSPDGPFLWVWSQDGSVSHLATQIDPATGQSTGVSFEGVADLTGGSAGGATISPHVSPGTLTFVGMHQVTPDTIVGYDLDVVVASDMVPWLSEDPITGTVAAGDSEAIDVVFDAAYVNQPGEYYAELVAGNDTPYDSLYIPVTMTVEAPNSWAKLSGTVTGLGACDDDPAPLEEAEVYVESATTGHTWTVTTDISGTYQLWLDQAHSPLTVTVSAPDYYGQEGEVVVTQSETTVLDFDLRLQQPCLSYDPTDFDVTLPMGDNLVETLTLSNTGAGDAEYELFEIAGGIIPMQTSARSTQSRAVELSLAQTPATNNTPSKWTPMGDIELAVDDGTAEDSIGLTAGGQFLWLNRFTPDPADFPFHLDQISIIFNDTVNVGDDIQLVIWQDADGDPSNGAVFVYAENATVLNNDFVTWNDYSLASSPVFYGPGDVLVGVVNRSGAAGLSDYPAAVDQSSPSQQRSWIGLYSGDPPDPPTLPADSDFGIIDDLGLAGNWTLRASGATGTGGGPGGAIPWVSEDPITGTIATDDDAMVDLTFDAGVPETMQPGTYYGELKVDSNAANDVANVPLTLTVTPPDDWGKLMGEVTGLGYCDTVTPTLLEDAEITVESGAGAIAWDLTTDVSGTYQLWLDSAHNPLTVTVAHPDHVTQVFTDVTVTAGGTTVLDAALRWDQPCLTAEPIPLEMTVTLGMSETTPFSVTNMGAVGSSFALSEMNGGYSMMSVSPQLLEATKVIWNEEKLAGECAAYQDSILSEPAEAAECYDYVPEPSVFKAFPTAPTDLGYAQDIGFVSENFISFQLNDFPGQTVVGTSTNAYYGMDFDPAAEVLYALNDDTDELGTIDLADGTFTSLVSCPSPSGSWTGLTIDPVSGKFYASDTTDLYEIDPGTGATSLIGTFGGGVTLMIDIAMNMAGEMYGHDIGTDSIYQIDPATGAATLVGSTGYDANFAQGMDFDNDDGTLYIFLYQGGGSNVYGVVDLTTGAVTPLAVSDPQGEFEGAVQTSGAAIGGGIPWLSEDPITGTVDADDTSIVDLTFDATDAVTQVTQPGEYFGTLFVNSDDPINDNIPVPVTMTVEPPATWGKLMGTVQSLGYCDADPAPVAGQDVLIEGSGGVSWTLTTDVSGTYQLWLDEMYSPLTVTVAATDHETGTVTGVTVISGTTTTQNLDLRWLEPCVEADPMALHATLELGATATEPLTLTNTGAVSANWDLAEENLGAPTVTPPGYIYYLNEDFEGAFPPAGWVVTETGATDDPGWVTTTARVYSGNYAVYHDDASTTGNSISWLIMPQVTVPADGADLTFWQNQNFDSWYTYHGIWISTASNDPADFVELNELGAGTEDVWEEVMVNLDAYAGQAVYLAFRYEGNWSDEWYIDDVAIQQVDPVTWLAENPASGTLIADTGEQIVDVDFDASVTGIDQPGDYLANLWVNSDDPFTPAILPVTMTVTPPATWGVLDGVVSSLGHCDVMTAPVEGAEVVIWDSAAPVVTLTTDISGTYNYWLPADTYTVTFSAPDHATEVITDVLVTAAATTTQNASLTWLVPCVSVEPDAIEDTLAMGTSATHFMTITNAGAGDATFDLVEYGELLTLSEPWEPVAQQQMELVTVGDNVLAKDSNPPQAPAGAKSFVSIPRPNGVVMLTHSASQQIMAGNSVACGSSGLHADNSYVRVFDLAAFGITDYFDVQSVDIGIETATAGSGGMQPATVNLYTLDGPLAWANMTLIGTADVDVADQDLNIITVPVTGTAPAGSTLVVEFFTPSGQAAGNGLYVGSNNLGQTGPTYLAAEACGVTEPTDVTALGFPGMHLVMNVSGFTPEPVDVPWLFEDPISGTILTEDSQGITVTLDAEQVPSPGTYYATIGVNTDDPETPRYPVTVIMTATLPPTYGQITGTVAGLGPCDDPLTAEPLEGADVLVASATQTWTLTTDADGAYAIWLDEAHSPITITVDAMDYVSDTVTGVTVISGTTSAAPDVALRPLAPCATVTPLMIEESLTLGMSTTVPITIGNTGAYTLAWSLSDDGVMWMDQDPTAGETAPDGGTSAVTVTLDTAGFDQPGAYTATLFVDNDSINDPLSVPVTLTVEPPATWGKLEGLVQGLGYCDAMTMPIEGAHVSIQSWMTETVAAGLEEDFEGDDGGFVGSLDWEWGTYNWDGSNCGYATTPPPAPHSGTDMWGTVLNDCYNNLGDTSILSFSVDLTDPLTATLSWWDWYEVYETFDHGEVYVNGNLVYDPSGQNAAWVEHSVDLTPYVGGVATIEFRMYATTVVERAGWYVDDVRVETDVMDMTVQPVDWLLTTDVSGTYGLWLDEMYSPLTVTIAYEAGYEEQVFTNVEIVSDTITTLDANLNWLQPCLTSTPDALDLSVPMGTTATAEINLANMGAFTGSFLLNEQSLGFDMMAAGGPDGFGYRFADSNEAGVSPVYDFVDISEIGTSLALGDNDYTEVDIGFDFKFYGADELNANSYDTVFVNSNGFLSFGAGSDDLSPDPALPDSTLPNNLISAAWDDLKPGTVYVESFAQCPYNPNPDTVDACFIVQYEDFTHSDDSPAGTWEIILFHSGSILMQYAEADAPDATTGIENQFGNVGLDYGATLADDLAICFAYPGEELDCQSTQVSWLDVDVDEGDIAAYDDLTVTVTLDASVTEIAAPGDYLAELVIESDDPINPSRSIPVTMTVDMPTMSKMWGNIYGWSYCDAVSETMEGAEITIWTEDGDSYMTTSDTDGAYAAWVEPGPMTMTVAYDGYISMMMTDTLATGVAPRHDAQLHLDAPCAGMTYDQAFDVVVAQGEQVTRSLMLNNDGAGWLTYDNMLATGLWLSVDPVTGSVAPYDAQSVNVVFDAAGLDVGVYQSNMEIAHNDLQASRMFVRPIQMTVVADGTILMPTMDAKEGNPGETVTYMMTVTNYADTAVTFDVLASGNIWTTTVPSTVDVAASDTTTFTVDVDIPVDAHTGYSDTVTIDVESQGTDEQQASALLQTTVAEQPVVLALSKTADPSDYVMPGDTITYTIDLVNDGNDPLTIILTDTIPDDTTYVVESVTGGAEFDDPPGDHISWSGILDKGAEHTITFQVTVDADLANGTPITNTVMVDADGEIHTESAIVEAYALTLDVAVEGEGTVQVEPEQELYSFGQSVILTATADPGWTFTGWSGDVDSTDNPLTITIESDTVVTATFEAIPYTLTVNEVGNGSVTVDPEQDTYIYGDVVTLTATADPDWAFTGWSGDVDSTDNPLAITIESDTAVTATFEMSVANQAPVFTSTPITTTDIGATYNYTATAEDDDGDTLTITMATGPDWLTLTDNGDGTALLAGTPISAGAFPVELSVTDGQAQDTQDFSILVTSNKIFLPLVLRQ